MLYNSTRILLRLLEHIFFFLELGRPVWGLMLAVSVPALIQRGFFF